MQFGKSLAGGLIGAGATAVLFGVIITWSTDEVPWMAVSAGLGAVLIIIGGLIDAVNDSDGRVDAWFDSLPGDDDVRGAR